MDAGQILAVECEKTGRALLDFAKRLAPGPQSGVE